WIPCLLSRGMAMAQRRCSTIGISYLADANTGFIFLSKIDELITTKPYLITTQKQSDSSSKLNRYGCDLMCIMFIK
ncbi:hypothetical protein, partial [Aeromonas veronii]|uniref:hypothetical protein n=1 Tax=Aeromonas veronii TaxID=654 RepID=UPI003B9E982E